MQLSTICKSDLSMSSSFLHSKPMPFMKINALHTALGRPLLAQRLVEVALEHGADAIAHGCTGGTIKFGLK